MKMKYFRQRCCSSVARDVSYAQARSNDNSALPSRRGPLCETGNCVIEIAIIVAAATLSVRRAIDRDELIQIPQSRVDAQFSAAIAIAVVIFCT